MSAIEIDHELRDMELSDTRLINGKVVTRWDWDSFEVVSYGRMWFRRDTACILIGD